MRIIFMGTPEFAVPALYALANSDHKLIGVISQPDREKDKKGQLLKTPAKIAAEKLGLTCHQFNKVSVDGLNYLQELAPDLIVTAAFGQLLKKEVLQIPKYGILNVHASLLPKYRGSSPIHAAILNGDAETGVTIMKTELSMDTGDMIDFARIPINDNEQFDVVQNKLAKEGAQLLMQVINNLPNCLVNAQKQDEHLATYCNKIVKADGLIDWQCSAKEICNQINAFATWPVAFTSFDGTNLKIYKAQVYNELDVSQSAMFGVGSIVNNSKKLIIKCGEDSFLNILVIQAPGKKAMPTVDFLRGFKIEIGKKFD